MLKGESQPTQDKTALLLIAKVHQIVKIAFLDVANVSALKMPKSIFVRAMFSFGQLLDQPTEL